MKKVICVVMILMVFIVSACGYDNGSDNNEPSAKKNTLSDEISYNNTANGPDEVMKKLFDNQTNLEEFNNLLYGDYDYAKAIGLYYECLNEIYEYDIIEKVDKVMLDIYNTYDYRTAFEIYYTDKSDNISFDQFMEKCEKRSPAYEEVEEYIMHYNSNIPSMSYVRIDSYKAMGGKYGEYMDTALKSVEINMRDIDKTIMYDYQGYDEEIKILCAEIDGEWYPVLSPIVTDFEYFATHLGYLYES